MPDGTPCHTSRQVKEWSGSRGSGDISDCLPTLLLLRNCSFYPERNEIKKEDSSLLPTQTAAQQQVWDSLPEDELQGITDSASHLQQLIKKETQHDINTVASDTDSTVTLLLMAWLP